MKSDLMQLTMAVLVFFAAACSIGSVSWCEQVDFTFTELAGNYNVSFGAWGYKSFKLVATSRGDLWTVDTCRPYPDDTPMDPHWRAAQAFGIVAPIWGILSFCPIFAISRAPSLAKLSGLLLLVAAMFQGLTLLILRSDLCHSHSNPMFDEYPILQSTGTLTTKDTCDLGRSSVVNIVSMCLWLVAGLIALVVPVEPVGQDTK